MLEDYAGLGPGDEPPYPADGLAPVVRQVVHLEARANIDGPMELIVDVDPGGEALDVAVYKTPDIAMAKAVSAVLMQTHFKPAKCAGHPCDGQYKFSFLFRRYLTPAR